MVGLGTNSRLARVYFASVILGGLGTVLLAGADLYARGDWSDWLALAALTLLTGSFTIRVPGLMARMSVSDTFVFASVLVFGPAVATVIVAIDSIVATLWMAKENRSILRSLFNIAAASLAIWVASNAFYFLSGATTGGAMPLSQLLGPLFVLALLYFLVNTWLVALALGFEKHASPIQVWWAHFPWLALNYFGGVSVAALLVSQTRTFDLTTIGLIMPLLVITYFTYRTSLGRLEDARHHIAQVNELYLSTIETLAMAVDAKDQITHGHIRRVQVYAVELAKRLGVRDEGEAKAIEAAALLHDMGKLAIPEHILNKPGKLTTTEFEKMKQHASIGADLLSSVRFPYPVVPIVRHHHEQWGGNGYPAGISGTDIPLGARILSVVDCFDALTSDRPYRPGMSTEEAFRIIRERRGSMYDPLVVDTFIAAYDEIAPLAIKAGIEARSFMASSGLIDTSLADLSPAPALEPNSDFSKVLATADSIAEAMAMTASHLRQVTPATVYALYRYEQSKDAVRCEHVVGDQENLLAGLTIPLGERITGWCGANQRVAVNSDATLDLGPAAAMFSPPLRSTISAPLIGGNKLTGVLTAYSVGLDAFTEAHLAAFERAASSLSARLTSSAVIHR